MCHGDDKRNSFVTAYCLITLIIYNEGTGLKTHLQSEAEYGPSMSVFKRPLTEVRHGRLNERLHLTTTEIK